MDINLNKTKLKNNVIRQTLFFIDIINIVSKT